MEGELAILKTQVDSCNNLISEYQYEIEHCKGVYAMYNELIKQKDVVLALDGQEIRLLKKRAKLLQVKLISTGVALPVAAGGAGVAIAFLIMTLKK